MTTIADGECFATLRNVAPKPVRYEWWIAGDTRGNINRHSHYPGDAVASIRFVWNSDGSPVEDANDPASLVAVSIDRDYWKAKAEALQAEVERLKHMPRCTHEDEIARMRPVYDAAVAWDSNTHPYRDRLLTAVVLTAQQTEPKEPSHD